MPSCKDCAQFKKRTWWNRFWDLIFMWFRTGKRFSVPLPSTCPVDQNLIMKIEDGVCEYFSLPGEPMPRKYGCGMQFEAETFNDPKYTDMILERFAELYASARREMKATQTVRVSMTVMGLHRPLKYPDGTIAIEGDEGVEAWHE